MTSTALGDLQYDMELDKAVQTIKDEQAKTVLLQFPDGLKPWAAKVAKELEQQTDATILIWTGSCYGGCDIPQVKHVDLLIQWGHNQWQKYYEVGEWK